MMTMIPILVSRASKLKLMASIAGEVKIYKVDIWIVGLLLSSLDYILIYSIQ
jgi:hypothetical protein